MKTRPRTIGLVLALVVSIATTACATEEGDALAPAASGAPAHR